MKIFKYIFVLFSFIVLASCGSENPDPESDEAKIRMGPMVRPEISLQTVTQ